MGQFKTLFTFFIFCFNLLLLCSCGSPTSEDNPQTEVSTPQDQPATLSDASQSEKENEGDDILIDDNNPLMKQEAFRRIAAILPGKANGVEAGTAEGWVKAENGSNHTYVKRSYKNPENKSRLDLGISDAGNATLESLNLIKYWNNKKIDTKSDKGHEKTLTYKSFPAFEKCNGGGCDLYFAVDNRFLISAYVNNKIVTDDRFLVFDQININQLRKLPR